MTDINELKSTLNIMVNEYKMLNNTLTEMIQRNSSVTAINGLKHDIEGLLKAIEDTTNEIKNIEENETEDTVYTTYKKDTANKSFFDSITKQNKATEYINDYQNKKNRFNTVNASSYMEEIRNGNITDNLIATNRFLVRFEGINIQPYYVKWVNFSPNNNNELEIMINNHMSNGKPIIVEICEDKPFNISIDYLDASDNVLYTETYYNCKVKEFVKGSIGYSSNDFSTIEMFIRYSKATTNY